LVDVAKKPILVRPQEGETADEFADRVLAMLGLDNAEDDQQ